MTASLQFNPVSGVTIGYLFPNVAKVSAREKIHLTINASIYFADKPVLRASVRKYEQRHREHGALQQSAIAPVHVTDRCRAVDTQ